MKEFYEPVADEMRRRHDAIAKRLEARLEKKPNFIWTKLFHEYGPKFQRIGEVDIEGMTTNSKGDLFYRVYEVKASPREYHAERQIRRRFRYLHRRHNVPFESMRGVIRTDNGYRRIYGHN